MDRDQPPKTHRGGSSREGPGTCSAGNKVSGAGSGGQARSRRDHSIKMLADEDPSASGKAAEALRRLDDPESVNALTGMLRDNAARVRLKAAWALEEIGDMRTARALRHLYPTGREDARENIRYAIDAISMQGGPREPAGQ